MKIAFHFNSSHPQFAGDYASAIERLVFSRVLAARCLQIATKVFRGDFPLRLLAADETVSQQAAERWRVQAINGWRRFTSRTDLLTETDIFVICFESVGLRFGSSLHDALSAEDSYMGAVQVDDSAKIHWDLYSALELRYRITDRKIASFYDEAMGDEKPDEEQETMRLLDMGFTTVRFEQMHGKHTFFDTYHTFEHARRVSEWKLKFGDLLGFMADEVICRLGDHIPELPNKLWTAVETYEEAETDEQYALVSTSCRRILETVADKLFPPTSEVKDGHKLGPGNYRNRLLAFVKGQTASGSQIELIASGLDLFAQHVEKLQDFANKGVHSEIQREGARRALLRTVLLLDDIVALRPESFPLNPTLDFSWLEGGAQE